MIPAPPDGAATRFNAPPTWPVPSGFDPRRGHLPDPAWPAPPQGWVFWVPDPTVGRDRLPVPGTSLPVQAGRARAERRRVFVALGVAAVILGGAAWFAAATSDDDAAGVGSCWGGTGEWLDEVSCESIKATHVVVEVTSSANDCPMTSSSYLEVGGDVLCLEPHTWTPPVIDTDNWPPSDVDR